MKTFKFSFLLLIMAGLLSGCAKDEGLVSQSENSNLKSANTDKVTITRTLPNGKIVTVTVPAHAVESIINGSPKLPYSPEGVYVLYREAEPGKYPAAYYDLFITFFTGSKFIGTCGFPAGGPYEYVGEISGGFDCESCDKVIQYYIGDIVFEANKTIEGLRFATCVSGGILNFTSPSNYHLSLEPYSMVGVHPFCEYNEDGEVISYLSMYIREFDGESFTGEFQSDQCKITGTVEGYLKEGSLIDETVIFIAILKYVDVKEISVEGRIHITDGVVEYFDPYGFMPPSIIINP